MIDLITIDQAKLQCRIVLSDSTHDAYLNMIIPLVSRLVMDHAKLDSVPDDWIVNTTASPVTYDVPAWAVFATLVGIAEAFDNREAGIVNVLSDNVKNLIPRTPTLA